MKTKKSLKVWPLFPMLFNESFKVFPEELARSGLEIQVHCILCILPGIVTVPFTGSLSAFVLHKFRTSQSTSALDLSLFSNLKDDQKIQQKQQNNCYNRQLHFNHFYAFRMSEAIQNNLQLGDCSLTFCLKFSLLWLNLCDAEFPKAWSSGR